MSWSRGPRASWKWICPGAPAYDLRILKEYADEGKLKLDQRIIKQDIGLLPEEDQGFVRNKLRELGFID